MARRRLLSGKWLLSSSASQKPSANFPKVAIAVEHAVEHRAPPQGIGPQILEILQADEDAAPADGGVGEGEPDAKAERIGQENREQADRRRQAHDDQERLVVEQPDDPARLSLLDYASRRQCRHRHRLSWSIARGSTSSLRGA